MKPKYSQFIFVFLCFLAGACSRNKGGNVEDFKREIYTPRYSSGFDIKGADGKESVIISVKNPWQGASDVNNRLFVARNGEEAPKDFQGQVLKGNAHRIVTLSSTHIAMLDAVGESGSVVGVSGLEYISNADIQKRKSEIADVGYDGNINYELLLSLNPDLVLLYGISGANSMEGKLRELVIPYIYVGDYLEENPLGKAEWLVALAEIAGKRAEGEKVFSGIPDRYNALKKKVSDYIAKYNSKPTVMVNAPYGDSWSMPPTGSYAVQLISDAGGDIIYKSNSGNSSKPIDIEEAYKLTSESDYWLNTGMARSLEELKTMCPKFSDTHCFTSGHVYNNNLRTNSVGGNDYFESGVVNPDVILRDLIKIFYPDLIKEDFVYYQQLK